MESINHMLNEWQKDNHLLYVTIVLPKIGRKKFYGRILSFNSELGTILFYCEDTSSTELVSLRDIDSVEPAKF